jgi:hypothetical protein
VSATDPRHRRWQSPGASQAMRTGLAVPAVSLAALDRYLPLRGANTWQPAVTSARAAGLTIHRAVDRSQVLAPARDAAPAGQNSFGLHT